jgi:NAD(P)H-hydrate epimerase
MKEVKASTIPAISRDQMVEVDRLMIEEFSITLLQMMENAGRNLALLANEMLGKSIKGKHIGILCGGGNNGGGGMSAGRHLMNHGAQVQVALAVLQDGLKEAPARQFHILKKMGADIAANYPPRKYDLLIDALIGYGLRGVPRKKVAEWIKLANNSGIQILSLDVPSGLDADSGQPLGACIRASATLTLALPKTGLLLKSARKFVGDLYVGDISVPNSLLIGKGINPGELFCDASVVRVIG